MATRKMLFEGRVLSSPAAATILINGTEVYSGLIGAGKTLDEQVELLQASYTGNADDYEDLTVSINMTSGVAAFGLVYVDVAVDPISWAPASGSWANYSDQDEANPGSGDGRTAILVNGLPPEWPATPVVPMPLGTEENPDWSYWHFELSAGETLTFNYKALSYNPLPELDYIP